MQDIQISAANKTCSPLSLQFPIKIGHLVLYFYLLKCPQGSPKDLYHLKRNQSMPCHARCNAMPLAVLYERFCGTPQKGVLFLETEWSILDSHMYLHCPFYKELRKKYCRALLSNTEEGGWSDKGKSRYISSMRESDTMENAASFLNQIVPRCSLRSELTFV